MHKAIVFWGLCAILIFVPLPIGSVVEWAIFVFEAATLLLLLVYLGGEALARRKNGVGGGASGRAPSLPSQGMRTGVPPEKGYGAPIAAAGGGRSTPAFRRGHAAPADRDAPGAPAPSMVPLAVKILLGVFLSVSILQLIPLPHAAVSFLSPKAAAIYQSMARDGIAGWGAPAPAPGSGSSVGAGSSHRLWTLSLAPPLTLYELTLMICYGIFGFLVLRTVRSRREIEIFVLVILAAALFQAFYGMAETFSGSEKILGVPKKYNLGSVTGTFVNRNHLAGFLEMAFPLSLGYLLAKAKYFLMERRWPLRRKLLWFGQESLHWSILLGLGSVLIGVALVFSKSRSGVMVFAVTLVLAVGAIATWRDLAPEGGGGGGGGQGDHEGERGARRGSHRAGRRRTHGIVRAVFAAVVILALWLGIDPIIQRFTTLDITKESRRVFMTNTIAMIRDFPAAGTGKGTYLYAYPMYQKLDTGRQLSFAHNDYLEYVAENGIPAGGSLIAAGVLVLGVAIARWRRRRDNFAKGVGLGAILAVAAIMIHGFTDFNLQIPANAVYFTGMCALALNATGRRRGSGRGGDGGEFEPAGGGGGAKGGGRRTGASLSVRVAAVALSAVVLLVLAGRDFLGYHYQARYDAERTRVRSIQAGFPTLERLIRRASRASRIPDFRRAEARLYNEMARAENDAGNPERRDVFCDRAVAAFADVLDRNPTDAYAHYETGMTYLYYNYPLMTYVEKAKVFMRKALEVKPCDLFLNVNILYLYLTWWDQLTDEEKAYVLGQVRRIRASDPAFAPQLEERWRQTFGSTAALDAILGSGLSK